MWGQIFLTQKVCINSINPCSWCLGEEIDRHWQPKSDLNKQSDGNGKTPAKERVIIVCIFSQFFSRPNTTIMSEQSLQIVATTHQEFRSFKHCPYLAPPPPPKKQRTQGIDSITWVISPAKKNTTCIGSKFGRHVVPLVLVPLTNRWRHKHCSTFSQHVMSFALVPILATSWRYLHWLQVWPPGGATCISSKFCQQ